VYIAGQAGHLPHGVIAGDTIVRQFEVAAGNVVKALAAAGGLPEHVVAMQILTTDAAEYRASLEGIGAAYRRHFGRHYPAITLAEVKGLFDPAAKVELTCVAVVP
jgi:enamine deaminase RidA (YjgF/YER057c/UK114 family)